jgi:Domain of unknown function (DUF4157)
MSQDDRVTLRPVPPELRRAIPASGGILQRKCACGGSGSSQGECEQCKKKEEGTLQRRASTSAGAVKIPVPAMVHHVLNSPGRPLEAPVRAFFEARMGRAAGYCQISAVPAPPNSELAITQPGDRYEREADRFADGIIYNEVDSRGVSGLPLYDLSRIRIYTDQPAAEASAAVNAHAFTVGHHLVFGAGSYNHDSIGGLRLIAHELAHMVQQTPGLARQPKDDQSKATPSRTGSAGTCLGPDICNNLVIPSKLLAQAAANPQNQGKREHQKQICRGTPPPAACTADGHGAPAVQTRKLLHDYDFRLPAPGVEIVVDKDMEQDFGALTISCDRFVPPITHAARCITIPESMEKEAAQFNNTMDPKIVGKERGLWRERTLEILVHESAHTHFREAFATGRVLAHEPRCANQDTRSAMSELVAMLNELPLRMERIRTSVSLASAADRAKELEEWRNHRIRGTRQSITVSLRTVRCACPCNDAEKMIKEAIQFATASWTQKEKNELHQEMRNPMWTSLDFRWPFAAPPNPSVTAPPASSSSLSP